MKIGDAVDNTGVPENEFIAAENSAVPGVENPVQTGFGFNIMDILLTETGPEDDYLNHPLNFAKSEGLGQIIRGVTGFLQKFTGMSSLKLAILDVVFGWLKFSRERGANSERTSITAGA